MNLGVVTLIALGIAITLSCVTRLHVGLLSIGFAWVIGVYMGGMPVGEVTSGFPVNLFLTLAGVSLLFSQARVNGTLGKVANAAVQLCRGRVGLVPIMYFGLGAVLASSGPGNIATTGLLAPMAMATAIRMNIPLFLMAIMVGNGANSGSLSPIAPTGLIVTGVMDRIGLGGLEVQTWIYNFLAHALVAFGGYLLFGGWKLLARSDRLEAASTEAGETLDKQQKMTLVVIALLIAGVIFLDFNIGLAAFAGAVVLALLRAANEDDAIKGMPWGAILLVCGVTVLISLLERTQGMEILTSLVTEVATRNTIVPLVGFLTGLISAYSSTSGVVLPAFLPMVPGLSDNLGGGLNEAIAFTMNVAGHLVDVSPLSTIGALCVASVAAGPEGRRLFNQLLAWGLSMTVVGALLTWILFG
ncbi:MAG: SLC13 family permease [Gemmatimonadales bacterium]